MATRATMASRRIGWAAVAAWLLGCASSGGASGETHFVCAATADCAVHGAGYACVNGTCRTGDGGATPTPDASMPATGGRGGMGGTPARGGAGDSVGGGGSAGVAIGGVGAADSDAATTAARAAVTLSISPTPGNACNHTSPQLSVPSAQNTAVFGSLLGCNLMDGCRPDQFVVVDRTPGTSVSCSVSPNGANFVVSVTLNVEGSPSMQFQANGLLSPTGGTLSIVEANSEARGGGSDPACMVSIQPNVGVIAGKKIWAQFQCTSFRDPNDLSDTGCTAKGAFLFEDCSG